MRRRREVQLAVEGGAIEKQREIDRDPAGRRHGRPGMALGDDRAPGRVAVDHALHVTAGIGDATMAGGGRHVAGQVVQVDVQTLEELERPASRTVEGDRKGRTLAAGQEAAGQDVHRLHQVVEPAEVDGGLGGALHTVPVGLDVALDDRGPELGLRQCRRLREVPKDLCVGPAGAGLELLRAHENVGMIPDLVGHLDHGHETGVHADHVDLVPEEMVGRGEDALELLVVQAVGDAVVIGNAAACGGRRRVAAREWCERSAAGVAEPRQMTRPHVLALSSPASVSPAARRNRSRG